MFLPSAFCRAVSTLNSEHHVTGCQHADLATHTFVQPCQAATMLPGMVASNPQMPHTPGAALHPHDPVCTVVLEQLKNNLERVHNTQSPLSVQTQGPSAGVAQHKAGAHCPLEQIRATWPWNGTTCPNDAPGVCTCGSTQAAACGRLPRQAGGCITCKPPTTANLHRRMCCQVPVAIQLATAACKQPHGLWCAHTTTVTATSDNQQPVTTPSPG